jgi:YVTN family beta-propeller protein
MTELFQLSEIAARCRARKVVPAILKSSRDTRSLALRLIILCGGFLLVMTTGRQSAGHADSLPSSAGQTQSSSQQRDPSTKGGETQKGAEASRQVQPAGHPDSAAERFIHEGISVEFSLTPVSGQRPLVENRDVEFRFRITDVATGTPLRGAHPSGWMDLCKKGEAADLQKCTERISGYLNAGIVGPHPIDLNSYYVITLNQDATVTVVDPRFGYGGTKLLAMLVLKSPGDDWALDADDKTLFVSMPDSNQVAAADTAAWKVSANIDTGPHPTRVALQPDEHYLWIAYGDSSTGSDSGVSVAAVSPPKEVARIRTGKGGHEIAFSGDNRYAFITNGEDGTVSIIDIRTLKKIKDVYSGKGPASIAFSSIADAAYVANEVDGTIAVVRADPPEVTARVQCESGLRQIKFAPGTRLAFLVNPAKGKVYVLDASSNRVVQTGAIDGEPDQIGFSSTLAYIRRKKSETVMMIPFSQVGVQGKPIPLADFPGGQHAMGDVSRPSPADSIIQVPGENAVLVANSRDKSVYYYMEGMAAPMGNFSNYGREPRAVLIVDKSLREREPGVYSAYAKLRGPGAYSVAFLMDSPRIVHCFEVNVQADPGLDPKRQAGRVMIQHSDKDRVVKVGVTATLEFRLVDPATGGPIPGVKDLQVLTFLAPGQMQKRQLARETSPGVYSIELAPSKAGFYYVYFTAESLGLKSNNDQFFVVEAKNAGTSG